jgi:hypothetical protein
MLKSLLLAAFVLTLILLPLHAAEEEAKVYNNVSNEALEKLLDSMDIKYKKVPAKKDGVQFYDLESGDRVLRLHNYQGQDLWLDCIFTDKLSLADVNGWNARARFSRAVLLKADDKTSISLESQLDCLGGVTDAIVRRFIRRFGSEVRAFEKYLTK